MFQIIFPNHDCAEKLEQKATYHVLSYHPKQRKVRMSGFSEGTKVKWNWGNGEGIGIIKERFEDDVTKTIKGTEVTRNATASDPAYMIEQDDGDKVLKGHSEVEKA